ncbi:MAG: DUF1641 domain-containing protein [Desulfurococcales archaeon]|nr:DUF1641 domain-containing protein [Desulfurococcales archaeon]
MERDALEAVLTQLEDKDLQESILKVVELAKNLNRSGVLDMLIALTDKEALSRLVEMLMTPGTMKLMDNLDELTNIIGDIAVALKEPVEPVTITGLLRSLSDPEVSRGLARLILILRILGRA